MKKLLTASTVALSLGISSLALAQDIDQGITLNRDSIWNILTPKGEKLTDILISAEVDWESITEELPNNLYAACIYHIITTSNGNPSEESTKVIWINEESHYVDTSELDIKWRDCKDKIKALEKSWDIENNKPKRIIETPEEAKILAEMF